MAIPALELLLLVIHLSFLTAFSLEFDPPHSSFNSSKLNGDSRDGGIFSTRQIQKKLNPSTQNLTMSDVYIGTKCDIFSGSWVHDLSYPLYDWRKCPYIDGKFSCRKNGRPDSDYEKWRWKPRYCNIPRFNAMNLLQKLRGKTIMFVGDSLNREQWQSMICLLHAALPQARTSFAAGDPLSTFKALDYNVSVSFYPAPCLVDMVTTVVHGQQKIVVRLDSAEINGRVWKDADVLVFNSGHWWTHTGKFKGWDFMQEGNRFYAEMDPMVAYKKGLTTWANWIDSNIDTRSTRVFFDGWSPLHFSDRNGHNCYYHREPMAGSSYRGPYPPESLVAEGVVRGMKSSVTYLNITTLSLLREDAHPSIYGKDFTAGQRKNPDQYGDCSHWCLPGLPDSWNELLYSVLFGF